MGNLFPIFDNYNALPIPVVNLVLGLIERSVKCSTYCRLGL